MRFCRPLLDEKIHKKAKAAAVKAGIPFYAYLREVISIGMPLYKGKEK